MNDEQLIELAFLIKAEEDAELKKLLEQAEYQFVSVLIEYILAIESTMEDALQADYEEIQEIVDKITAKFTKKAPTEKRIRRYLKKRSFKARVQSDVLPKLEDAFFVLLEEFKEMYGSYGEFDSKSEAYKELQEWLEKLPDLLKETTDNTVVREIDKFYSKEEDKKDNGLSIAELAVFGYFRARSIAIAEILRMYGSSQYEAMMLHQHVIGSQWQHADGVKEPRPAHVAANGMYAAKGEFFYINGTYFRYPRDPKAPIEETINCHCYLVPVFDYIWNVMNFDIERSKVN